MRDPQGEWVTPYYHFAVWFARLLLRLFSRWQIIGLERVPPRGPLIVVGNHNNGADPSIVIAIVPRVVHMMAKQEIFDGPLGWAARWYGAFPVHRGQADRQAIRTALAYLKRGSSVGLFPEGTRSSRGALGPGQPGAGLIAVRSGATIVPIAILGTHRLKNPLVLLTRPKIDIIIGEPFVAPPHEGGGRVAAAERATTLIMERIAALLPREMRGHYAAPTPTVATEP